MKIDELLLKWRKRARRAQIGHFETVARLERLKYWLGIPVVVLSTVVGTSVFATLQKDTDIRLQIATASASTLAAVLASIQTFLRHAERAEKHRMAASRYGRLKKDIEKLLTFPLANESDAKTATDQLLERIDKLSEESPPIPKRIWAYAEVRAEKEE